MTFGDIKARIADELVRPDLASQIALAVGDAISEAATTSFWFNEVRGLTFTMTTGIPFYTGDTISGLSRIDSLWIVANNQRVNLDLASPVAIDQWNNGQSALGQPFCYARQANGLVFWMVPDQPYPVYMAGTTRFAPLTLDTDTNPYLTEGERYIRAIAKAIVLEDVIRDVAEADRQWTRANREKAILLAETGGRLATRTNAAFM